MSSFERTWEACAASLHERLDAASVELLEWFLEQRDEDSLLWVDVPLSDADPAALSNEAAPGLVVFTQPVDRDVVVLSAAMLGREDDEGLGFVFLAEVRVTAITTTPGTVAVFAGGLHVEDAACFSADDASTHVAVVLRAERISAGHGQGELLLSPQTEVRVAFLTGAFGGTQEVRQTLPFLAEEIDDDDEVGALSMLNAGSVAVPKGFAWPAGYEAPRFPSPQPVEIGASLDPSTYATWLEEVSMSIDARELLAGMNDELRGEDEEDGPRARRCSGPPTDFSQIPERVVIVGERINQVEPLCLGGHGDDAWTAYVFLKTVHCGDLSVQYNVMALFCGGLRARVVAPRPADTHLLCGDLECAVLCNNVYVRRRPSLRVGVIAGAICRAVDEAEVFEEYADELDDGAELWSLLSEVEYEHEDEPEPPERSASRFEISAAEALERLSVTLPKASFEVVARFLDRSCDGSVLWVDEPWAQLGDERIAQEGSVALIVFEEPLGCEGPLTLTHDDLIGGGDPRDEAAYVFLGAVQVEAITTVPGTLAVFAGGLWVEQTACFRAADADSFVHKRLTAAAVISGGGEGWLDVRRWCSVDVGEVIGSLRGGPTRLGARSIGDAYPQWRDALEDGMDPWECFVDAIEVGDSVLPA